jgi:hypothetical protein
MATNESLQQQCRELAMPTQMNCSTRQEWVNISVPLFDRLVQQCIYHTASQISC